MMILPRFEYRKARTLEEAINLFLKSEGTGVFLAGGTDLIPRLKLRLLSPSLVIDLKGIKELEGIYAEDEFLSIGANTTIFELKTNPLIRRNFPALHHASELTSCETLQMRGTIGGNLLQDTRCLFYNKSLEWRKAKGLCFKSGGNICHATGRGNVCLSNYPSDLAPALISLDAQVELLSSGGRRRVKLLEIYADKGKNPFLLKEGEILTRIVLKQGKTEGAFEKIRIRSSIDYPIINGALSVFGEKAIIAVGAVGPSPKVYTVSSLQSPELEEVTEKISGDLRPVANTVVRPEYRRKMGKVIIKKLVARVKGGPHHES